jgi:hypothetical protein
MAYQFADGFDNFGNTYSYTSGYPWTLVTTTGGACNTTTANVRFAAPGSLPGAAMVIAAGSGLTQNLLGTPSTLIVGFGVYVANLPASGYYPLVAFADTGTAQCSLSVNANGALQFVRGYSTALIGTASANGTIAPNTWYGLAMQITFSGSAGTASLYVNGSATPAINSISLNNIATANAYATQVKLGFTTLGTGSSAIITCDDFYCFDSTGAFNNSLVGSDARILTKMPASAGNYTNWTPNGLGSNFQNAAVEPPSTSDYNANNTPGTKDSYITQSASLAVAPYLVLGRASLERDDAGPHTPGLFVRSGSTDSAGVTTPALSSSYAFYDAVFTVDPSTSTAWTGPGADNAQIGIIEG